MNCDCKNIVNPSGIQLYLECLIGWGRKINKSFRPFWLKSNSVYNKQTNKQNTIDVKQWKREYTEYSRQIEPKSRIRKSSWRPRHSFRENPAAVSHHVQTP